MGYGSINTYDCYTAPIVKVWEGLIRRARDVKREFDLRGDQIQSFYAGGAGAMWQPKYLDRFMGGGAGFVPPKFKITLNVAFEQVAILGPLLFWEMAARKVKAKNSMALDPMGLAGGNQLMADFYNQLADRQASDDARNNMRAMLFQQALNYFQREQPGGGLSNHSRIAIHDALIRGAGFLKTEHYQFPGSERTLVGSFHEPVFNVFIDPNCQDPLWQKARWMGIRHRTLYKEAEEYFQLPPGSLRAYATLSSPNASYSTSQAVPDRQVTDNRDMIEWYECFSRAGFGNQLISQNTIEPEFDDARGDQFAYLCICPGCPYPLNLTSRELVKDYADSDYIKAKTDWPTEYWRDNKWPVEMLSFYPHDSISAWPEPPLSPAIGELTCLNILISAYVQGAYDNRQQIIGVIKNAVDDMQGLVQSNKSPLVLELDSQLQRSVSEVVSFLNRPEINGDLPQTIQFLLGLVEKRTGLSDMLYGGNSGANPRSATEYQGKLDTVNLRPEYMQKLVAAWHSNTADKEVFCAYEHCRSSDLAEELGPLGAAAWDELVTNDNPEAILRGSQCIVESSEIRRPNKSKDAADLAGMQQFLLPILAGHLAQEGDPGPLNGFVKMYGEATEQDLSACMIPPPQQNPEAQQLQQAQQEAELGKVHAETQKLTADAQKSIATAQATALQGQQAQQDAMIKQQTAEHGMAIKMQTAEHAAALKTQLARTQMIGKQQDMLNKQGSHEQSMSERQQAAKQKLALDIVGAHQKLNQNAANHLQQAAIGDQKADDDARRGNIIMNQRLLMNAAMHAQRMQQAAQAGGSDE